MYEPSEECVTDFWTKGILKNLPVSSSNPNFVKAASQLRDSCADKTICGKILSEDLYQTFWQTGDSILHLHMNHSIKIADQEISGYNSGSCHRIL